MGVWKNVPGVILSAGRSLRMDPIDVPKGLISVNGKFILEHVLDYWKRHCSRSTLIVSPEARPLYELAVSKVTSLPVEILEQPKPRGIADALALVEGKVGERFIVILGDCLCRGKFLFPEDMVNGFGAIITDRTEDILRSYTPTYGPNGITGLIEKPKRSQIQYGVCGMGYYFFSPAVFDYIRTTPPSALRGEVEITDVLDSMIKHGEPMEPVGFQGEYLNLTGPGDLERAAEITR